MPITNKTRTKLWFVKRCFVLEDKIEKYFHNTHMTEGEARIYCDTLEIRNSVGELIQWGEIVEDMIMVIQK